MRTTREVTRDECPWLDHDVPAGTEVFQYHGATYGCIGAGVAVSYHDQQTPFFELPADAVGMQARYAAVLPLRLP